MDSGLSLAQLKSKIKPEADVLVVNGFPASEDYIIQSGDNIVFICRGETPTPAELEALMAARHSPGVHARMKESVVGIAGLGGLGSAVAIALTRMGIGTLIIADFDIVEPSNLNRQQFFVEHLGLAKTDAMVDILSKINPLVRVKAHKVILNETTIPQIFQEAKIIVECFDLAEAKAMILEVVDQYLPETYLVTASGLAGYGHNNAIRTRRIGDKVFLVGDMVTAAEPGRGLMAPRVGIAAHHQANLVVSLLMDPERACVETEDLSD